MLRKLHKNYRRLVAFLLMTAMTFTNVGVHLNVAFAAGEEQEALFLVDGTDLREAVNSAVEDGEAFRFSSLELKAKTKSLKTSYEKLIGGKNGKVYQLDVDVDERYAPEDTSVEIFYNENTQEVVFLFINESDMVVRFRASVDGYETARVTINPNTANVDDTEASYAEDYSNTTMIDDMPHTLGAEVLNPTTEAADADEGTEADAEEPSEGAEETDREETGAGESIGNEGTGETIETGKDTGETAVEETTEAAGTEETTAEETTGAAEPKDDTAEEAIGAAEPKDDTAEETTGAAGPKDDTAEETTGAAGPKDDTAEETTEATESKDDAAETIRATESKDDTAEETTEASEAEGDTAETIEAVDTKDNLEENIPAKEASEADGAGEEAAYKEGTGTASISIRKFQQVASGKEIQDADIVMEPEDAPLDQETEISEDSHVEVETDAEETTKAEADDSQETEATETETREAAGDQNNETDATEEDGSDDIIKDTTATDEADTSEIPAETKSPAETEAPTETESPAETETSAETESPAETETPSETEAPAETRAEEQEGSGSPSINPDLSEGQELEDDIHGTVQIVGSLDGKAYNTVTIWGSANARAYKVAAKDLAGMEAAAGVYRVDYTVDPVGTADITGGPTIGEGENLYFAVNPQVGFEITTVTANGVELKTVDAETVATEAESLADFAYVYVVEDVTEDLEIVASLEETEGMTHPEFSPAPVTRDGVTITVHAEEGIIPAGTKLQVTEVTSQLKDAIMEKLESDNGALVQEVIAYDINLLLDGKKLDNSWSRNGCVDVTFSGSRIRSITEEADKISFFAVDDSKAAPLSARTAAGVTAEELKLEAVGETDVEDTSVSEVSFGAEHFSVYAVAAEEDNIPVVVQTFLNAVAGIPTITLDNAEKVAEYLYGTVADAYDALLGTEYMERKDVKDAEAAMSKAMEDVNAALGLGSSMYATNVSVYDNTLAEVKYAFYPILQITGASVNGGSMNRQHLYVGGSLSIPFVPGNGEQCPYCGYIFGGGMFAPTKYCETRGIDSKNIVTTKFGKTTTFDSKVGNTECLRMDINGEKPGTSNISVSYYCNFEMYILNSNIYGDNGGGKFACISCRNAIVAYNDATWHKYTHIVPVTVNADYVLNYDSQGGSYVAPTTVTKADTTARVTITSVKPTKEGFVFKGWAFDPEGKEPAGSTVTLNWEEGYGSVQNPVSKTLYAIWEKGTTYRIDREYYINGEKVAGVTGGVITGKVGEKIDGATLAQEKPNWNFYTVDGKAIEFTYSGCTPSAGLTLADTPEKNVITLRYDYSKETTYKIVREYYVNNYK